jgi:xylulokinase
MKYIIAFDVGTTNTKAVLTNMSGKIFYSCSESVAVHSPYPSYAEQKPDDWWRSVTSCSNTIMEKSGIQAGDVEGITFSSQAMSVTLVDDRGDAILPYSMIWRDNRANEEAAMLRKKVGGDKFSEKLLGVRLTGNYLISKYHWLIRNQPEAINRAKAILDQGAYLCLRATNELVCDWTHATSTGMLDLKKKTWNDLAFKLFNLSNIRNKFMRPVSPIDKVGRLSPEAARQTSLLEGTPVFAGVLDAMTAITGAGAASIGDGAITLGTSGNLGILVDKKIRGRMGLVTVQSADPNKLVCIGTSNAVCSCMNWAAQNLYSETDGVYRQIERDIQEASAGANGLMFAPWMSGERAPYQNDSLRGCFLNLNVNHKREHLIRAVAEGIAYNFNVMVETAKKQCGFTNPSIRVVGGGARLLSWMQLFADVMNRRIEVVPDPEMSGAVGAALLAAVGLGEYPSVEDAAKVIKAEKCLEPDQENHMFYKKRFEDFKTIYPSIVRLYEKWNNRNAED